MSSNKKNILKTAFVACLVMVLCILPLNSCKQYFNRDHSKEFIIEKKVDSLLALMTLNEKIGQMS